MAEPRPLDNWQRLVDFANSREPRAGDPGVRDPEHPCAEFRPTPDIDYLGLRVTAPGTGQCDSDGHYLCGGCAHLSERGRAERIGERQP